MWSRSTRSFSEYLAARLMDSSSSARYCWAVLSLAVLTRSRKVRRRFSRRRLSWRWRGVLCSRSNLTTPNRWACCYGACDKHTSFSAREVKGFIQKLNYNFFRFFGKIMRPSGFKKNKIIIIINSAHVHELFQT